MAKRKIHTVYKEAREVRVYWNAEFSEYVCRLYDHGELYIPADYFTDDKADAIETACAMLDS